MDFLPDSQETERRRGAFLRTIEDGTASFDGIMSPVTKHLVEKLKGKGVDMTSWWAMTPIDWTCPGCGREKQHIARLNKHGQVMCRLVEHHDHMQNLLAQKFAEVSASLSTVVADKPAERFAKRSATMISAYENTVVCDDCNNADTNAKKLVSAAAFFSFSPAEIRRFTIAVPHQPHAINRDEAQRIWEAASPTFELRLKIADRMATIAAKNQHWYQEGGHHDSPAVLERNFSRLEHSYQVYGLVQDLCGEKRVPVIHPARWRTKVYPRTKRIPTAGDIAHVAKVTHREQWESVPDDWSCPTCRRSKSQTVRQAKKGGWSGLIQMLSDRSHDGSRRGKAGLLCGDCSWTGWQLGKEAISYTGDHHHPPGTFVEFEELASIVTARPHARHLYNNDVANEVVSAIIRRIAEHLDKEAMKQ